MRRTVGPGQPHQGAIPGRVRRFRTGEGIAGSTVSFDEYQVALLCRVFPAADVDGFMTFQMAGCYQEYRAEAHRGAVAVVTPRQYVCLVRSQTSS